MSTQATLAEPATTVPRPNPRRQIIGSLVVGLIAPLALFYGLRSTGCAE